MVEYAPERLGCLLILERCAGWIRARFSPTHPTPRFRLHSVSVKGLEPRLSSNSTYHSHRIKDKDHLSVIIFSSQPIWLVNVSHHTLSRRTNFFIQLSSKIVIVCLCSQVYILIYLTESTYDIYRV